jgi:pimeloyl-ACP methyl ester carboxylesterase
MRDILNIRISDRNLARKLKHHDTHIKIDNYRKDDFDIRYVDVGNQEKRMVFLIHGAPDSLVAFLNILKDRSLGNVSRMIAVDRPGYGYSCPGKKIPPVKMQAAMLKPVLDMNRHERKPILVGHSYGGTIAARLAMDYPDQVGGLILVGAAVDPEHEKHFRISSLIRLPQIAYFLPSAVITANQEKLSHVNELEKMVPGWNRIRAPVTVLHGRRDWIVPVENAFFIERMITHRKIKMVIKEKSGHLIPRFHPEPLKTEIMEMLGKQ